MYAKEYFDWLRTEGSAQHVQEIQLASPTQHRLPCPDGRGGVGAEQGERGGGAQDFPQCHTAARIQISGWVCTTLQLYSLMVNI